MAVSPEGHEFVFCYYCNELYIQNLVEMVVWVNKIIVGMVCVVWIYTI